MARITTIEVHCPHCGKKLSTLAKGKRVYIGSKAYGLALRRCRRCKKLYRQFDMEEAALTLTESSRVKWYLSSQRFLVAIIIAACFYVTFVYMSTEELGETLLAALMSTVAVLGCMGGLGLITWPLRQWNKNRVLRCSRETLMQDDEYLLCTLGLNPAVLHGPSADQAKQLIADRRERMEKAFQRDELPL